MLVVNVRPPGFADALLKSGLNFKIWVNYKADLVNQLTEKSIEYLFFGKSVGVLLYSARSARQFVELLGSSNLYPNH